MESTQANERSAIVVAEVHNMVIGMLVDRVSDILTVAGSQIQPVPEVTASFDRAYSEGIIANENGMICFLNLAKMFREKDMDDVAA
jgi:purine-binding chemotaxis protein CheW